MEIMGSASQGLNREDRKWTVTVVLACVILSILLAALALVQYSWLADLRKAERQQMELSLKAAAGRFADDFVGELLRVVTAFQLEYGAPSQSLADQLSDAYEQWVGSAANPNLIRDLILVTGMTLKRGLPVSIPTYEYCSRSNGATTWIR